MKYQKNERVYVILRHRLYEATILDWRIDTLLRGPAEIKYLVHVTYSHDTKGDFCEEEDAWVDDCSVKKHPLGTEEKKIHNIVTRKKEILHNLANEMEEGPQQQARPVESGDGTAAIIPKNDAPTRNTRILEGRIYLFCVYVSEHWGPAKNRKRWIGCLKRAEAWIESQAMAHGKKVQFVNGSAGLTGEPAHCRLPQDLDHRTRQDVSVHDVLYETELRSVWSVRNLAIQEGCDCFVILILVDAPGRCYARIRNDRHFLGNAVIFGEGNGRHLALYPATFAHEILHFFGADDLYVDELAPDNDDKRRARSLWPEDIMLDSDKPFTDLCISPYTASLLGWIEKKDVWGASPGTSPEAAA